MQCCQASHGGWSSVTSRAAWRTDLVFLYFSLRVQWEANVFVSRTICKYNIQILPTCMGCWLVLSMHPVQNVLLRVLWNFSKHIWYWNLAFAQEALVVGGSQPVYSTERVLFRHEALGEETFPCYVCTILHLAVGTWWEFFVLFQYI